jgi:hypothetical protein
MERPRGPAHDALSVPGNVPTARLAPSEVMRAGCEQAGSGLPGPPAPHGGLDDHADDKQPQQDHKVHG